MNTNPTAPAFPAIDPLDGNMSGGLTKREYFAALAFQGLLADSEVVGQAIGIARTAVIFADALIEALNGETLPRLPLGKALKPGADFQD